MSVDKPTANYTGQGWEGKKYGETKNLSTTEIAKLIRKEIKQQFPGVKCSIRTEYFSMGSSIDVIIKEPRFKYTKEAIELKEEIKRIGNQYRYDDSDGMIDYADTNFYYRVTYPWAREYDWIRER